MNKYRLTFLTFIIFLSAFIAYEWGALPTPQKNNHKGFSSARVVEDLEVIAKEPHSIIHPEERAKVFNYLKNRLETLGGTTQTFHHPDFKFNNHSYDINNVLAEYPPLSAAQDTTYLMLVAHYDSRYPWKLVNDSAFSKGAADDGYGLGVILECVRQALEYRSEWNQGIKVLFTDAEEVGMKGMEAAYTHHREIFENVGLIINLEARGTYGPVLLFETSPGNEKLMQMYKEHANYPYTYSLTNVVYEFMPNATDFTIVKDSIPGYNFSSIADINHYHTDLDNLENISEKTIQHYGAQLTPLIHHYLTESEYGDANFLKAKDDGIFFTIPGLGMYLYSTQQYWIFCMGVTALFLIVFRKDWKNRKCKVREVAILACKLMIAAISTLLIGELVAKLCTLSVGTRFKWFGNTAGIPFDNTAMALSIIALFSVSLLIYARYRKVYQLLYATLSIMTILSLILLVAIGENMMFLIPLALSSIALILWQTTSTKLFLLLGIMGILLHACSFLFVLAMALTIGALGIVMLIAFFDIMLLIALGDLYLTDKVSNQIP